MEQNNGRCHPSNRARAARAPGGRWTGALLAIALAIVLTAPIAAAVDPAIPAPEAELGYAPGTRVTDYHGMERYFAALAEASPRVLFGSYGSDDEGRALRYVVISSADNVERLDAIRAATARLAEPRTLGADERASLVAGTPVVVWLNYSVDGNETAGLEAALMTAHHLAADTGNEVAALLRHAVVVMTPVANPSSHERWASWFNSFRAGPAGNPDPLAMEHNPPWGVLTNNNHFLVDLNRESVWATQSESAALRDLYYRWHPAVFVDLHGEYDEFTGPGYEEPLNPLYTAAQRAWFERFGRAIGARFAELGWSYWPWETGSFYPGFWESLGALNGAVGFTFETIGGGSKGLRYRREDGSLITLELAARQHHEASLAVLEAAVAGRQELLEGFADFWRGALELARGAPEKAFLIDPKVDPARAGILADMLLANRVELFRAAGELRARGVRGYLGDDAAERTFPPGLLVVPVEQPRARLVLTLLRRDFRLPEITLEEAETFRRNREKAGFENARIGRTTYLFYDVTAWSMPLTFHLPAWWVEGELTGALEPLAQPASPPPVAPVRAASYGYLFSGDGIASSAMLIDLLQRGLTLHVAYDGFAIEGASYPRGSILIRAERNPGVDLPAMLSAASERHGVAVRSLGATYSDEGPSMGSDRFVHLRRPAVAVLAGDPVSARSFGDLWFLLERLYGLEFTAVYREQLDGEGLDRYDVVVLPDGFYGRETFSDTWVEALRGWIARGGTLVCLGRASGWAADPELELSAARLRPAVWPPETAGERAPRPTEPVAGAILRAAVDPHHFLGMGYAGELPVLVRSNLAFEPDPKLAAPVAFGAAEGLRLAGFAYEDSLERLAGTPYLVDDRVGSGHVVLFLDDPNFRLYWRGLSRLFLNSLLLSPSL